MFIAKRIEKFYKLAQSLQDKTVAPTGTKEEKLDKDLIPARYITEEEIKQLCKKSNIDYDYLKFLGKGHYNIAYLYENKVVKFTKSIKDIEILQKFNELKNKAPNEFKKHFLNVFAIKYDADTKLYMTETEFLEPINFHIKNMGFSGYEEADQNYIYGMAIKNEDFILEALDKTKNQLDISSNNIITKIEPEIKNFLRSYKITDKSSQFKILAELKKEATKYILNKYPDLIKQEHDIKMIFDKLFVNLMRFVQNMPYETKSGTDQMNKFQHMGELPEFKSFYKFLQYLGKMGVKIDDLHSNNLMQRPSTKDIVLSDPGLFEFTE